MRSAKRASGFSLLEMLVAMAILGLSLGALYQATSGATRNVRMDEKYAYGVELARSLLADFAVVPLNGTAARGETTGGFLWKVATNPIPQQGPNGLTAGALQYIEVSVSWTDGSKARQVVLNSVVAGAGGT